MLDEPAGVLGDFRARCLRQRLGGRVECGGVDEVVMGAEEDQMMCAGHGEGESSGQEIRTAGLLLGARKTCDAFADSASFR